MESRITKKKSIEKSFLITSITPEESYPLDVLELITEIDSTELFEWGKSNIDKLQEKLFEIPSAKFYKKIQFVVRTLEIENEENELLTVRYIFAGKIDRSEAEEIATKFRREIELFFKGFISMKLNKMGKTDLMVTIIPLQFYNPLIKNNQFQDELLEMILNDPIKVFPNFFFIHKLYLNRA